MGCSHLQPPPHIILRLPETIADMGLLLGLQTHIDIYEDF